MSEEEKKAIEDLKILKLGIEYLNLIAEEKDEVDIKAIDIVLSLVDNQQKEIEKYKRYFKLAISDLQSEDYMQMPYENIEKYYSKREDIV